jgi:hypothetical protein
MKQLLRPLMLCPYCEHYTDWNTSSLSTKEWNRHIRKCMKKIIDEGFESDDS